VKSLSQRLPPDVFDNLTRAMQSLPDGVEGMEEIADAIYALMDEVPRKKCGSVQSNESTPTVDCLDGHFGAKTPTDTTPGPYDTFDQSWLPERTPQKEPYQPCLLQAESTNMEAGMKFTSTKEELDELYLWSQSFNTNLPEQDNDSQNIKNSDHCGPTNDDHTDLLYVFRSFIESESPELEEGITLLVHDIPRTFKYTHIFEMIDTLTSLDSVDYVYLPVSVDRPQSNHFWNKGYCFIHFSDAYVGQKFINTISDYDAFERASMNDLALKKSPEGNLRAVFAKFQGMSTNLINLIDIESKKWRPKNNTVYVRTSAGLSSISLMELRVLAKQHAEGAKACVSN
jgi:hypothetical protein